MLLKSAYILVLLFSFISAQQNLYQKYNLAKNYEAAGDFEKAESIYKELLSAQSWNSQYSEALNNLYLRQKKYDMSIDFLQSKIKENPGDIVSIGMLGSTYHIMGDYQKAFEIWDDALKLNPESANNYRIISNFASQNRAFDKSIEILEKAKNHVENKEAFMYDIATLYSHTMKYTEAANEYCSILTNKPESLGIIKNRMKLFLNNDEAYDAVIPVIRENYEEENKPELLELESYVYQLKDDYRKAFDDLKELDAITPAGDNIFEFARSAFSEEKFKIAAEAFNYFLEKYPSSKFVPMARIGYAKTLEAELNLEYDSKLQLWKPYYKKAIADKDDYRKIINTFLQIADESVNNIVEAEAYYRIGLIYMTKFTDADSAIIYFNKVVSADNYNSFSIDSKLRTAELMIEKNELEIASEILEEIDSGSRGTPDQINYVKFLQSKILFWNGSFNESVAMLAKVSSKMDMDYTNDAIELLMVMNTCKNDSLSLSKYSKADYYLYTGNFSKAEETLGELAENQALFVVNQISQVKLAEVLCAENRYTESIEAINGYLENEQNILFRDKMMYLLGNIYRFGLEDHPGAFKVYQKLLDIFPNSLYLSKSRDSIKELNLN